MPFYAQVNDKGIVVAVSRLSGRVTAGNMIELEKYDDSLLKKKYSNGQFIDDPNPPVEPEPILSPIQALVEKIDTMSRYMVTGAKAFKQPTGAHDAYAKGTAVLFQNKVYESLIDANTWKPTDYPQGWKLVE